LPYRRFRDLHLRHHRVPTLTDPQDDPESFYLPVTRWQLVGPLMRRVLAVNNTLLGRLLIGPALALIAFFIDELRALARGERSVWTAWGMHLLALVPVLGWLWWTGFAVLPYLLAVYLSFSALMIRTF